MTQAFATRMPRGFSWVWLAIVAVALMPAPLVAQAPPSAKDDKKPPVEEDKGDDEPVVPQQVFTDPNAKKALTVFNPLNFQGPDLKLFVAGDDHSKIQNMASRALSPDPEFIKRFVEYFAIQLTKRENINAVLNPPQNLQPNDKPSRALERAVDALNKPIIDAKANNNKEFLDLYYRTIFESTLPKLVESNHNYLTRIEAIIVLGMAGNPSPAALQFYTNQLKNPDQLLGVKIWAARGLSIASQQGKVDLDAAKANLAAEALIGVLESDPKIPWFVQVRLIEAIGSLRVASANTGARRIDTASVVMRYLVDPETRPIVRAWAAWALGLLRVPSNVSPYNFNLVGHEVGELAADLGNRIVQEYDDDPANFDKAKDMASELTGLLLFQVCPALIGEEGVRDSGLLRSPHKNAGDARPFLTELDKRVKAVSRSAYDLLRTAGSGNKPARNDLDAKLVDLKTLLANSVPKDRKLMPGGPEFPPNPAQVAGAVRHP